jgi:hypothetical protein
MITTRSTNDATNIVFGIVSLLEGNICERRDSARPIIVARTLTPTLDHKGVRGIGLLNPRYLFRSHPRPVSMRRSDVITRGSRASAHPPVAWQQVSKTA